MSADNQTNVREAARRLIEYYWEEPSEERDGIDWDDLDQLVRNLSEALDPTDPPRCTEVDSDHAAGNVTCAYCADNDVDMEALTKAIMARGVPAYVEHTGGGCQTIYAGTSYVDAAGERRWPCLAGPGWMEERGPRASLLDFHVGPDDDGETEGYTCATSDTVDSIAAKVVEVAETVRERYPRFRVITSAGPGMFSSRVYDGTAREYASDRGYVSRGEAQAEANRLNAEEVKP